MVGNDHSKSQPLMYTLKALLNKRRNLLKIEQLLRKRYYLLILHIKLLKFDIKVHKTANIDVPKAPRKAYLLPLVSEMTFIINKPMNEPKGKIDCIVTRAQLFPQ